MKKMFFVLRAAAIVLGLSALPAHSQGLVKVGVIGPFSGPAAASGIAMKRSFELVAEEINNAGGLLVDGSKKRLELIFEDCQSKPEVGVSAAQKLLNRDKVDVVLAELLHSSVALAIMELAPSYKGKIFMSGQPVSIDIANRIQREPEKYANYWKFDFNSDAAAQSVRETVAMLEKDGNLKPKSKTIAFVLEDTDFAKSNMEYAVPLFKKDGWTVSTVETVQIGHSDFYPQLSKLRASPPDVIFSIFTAPNSGVAFVKQMKEQGLNAIHLATYYPSLSEFVKGAGRNAEGLIYTPFLFDAKFNPHHKAVAEKLNKYTGVTASMDHAFGYCNAQVLFDAIKRAGSVSVEAMNVALSSTDYSCALGRWVFDPKKRTPMVGENYLALPSAQFQDGELRTIWPKGSGSIAYRPN